MSHYSCRTWPRRKATVSQRTDICLTSVNRIIKYNLRLKCMLALCGRLVPCSRLIVPVSLSEFFSPLTSAFSENIFHKCLAPLPLLSHKMIIKYLFSAVNTNVAEQIYTTPELCRWYQWIVICQFINFYIAEIWIHSAALP